MLKQNKLSIVAIILIVSIVSSTLYYKYSLKSNSSIFEKSYAYTDTNQDNYKKELIKYLTNLNSSFSESDYKISSITSPSDATIETITLTYIIDNTIETNKFYRVLFENKEIKDVYESTSKNINETILINRVNDFNKNEKEQILLDNYSNIFSNNKILNKDKSINQNRFASEVERYEEKYMYDYNTEELSYILNIYTNTLEEIKIVIN